MADRPQIIGTDDKGQFQVPLPRSQIERIDVIDIDFVLQTKSGERLIIPGAAMDAMTAVPPVVVFSDGPVNAAALLGMVEKVETPPVSIPAMTSLKEFDPKKTEGQKNVTRDGPEGRQTKSGEDADPQHQTQEQAQQVAPLPHQGAESTVDKLLAQAESLEAETLKKAFDPAPVKPYEPPASNPDAPGSQPPTARIPLYMALAEGNVVGVSQSAISETPTLLAKSGGVDIDATTAVTYTNLVSGSSGPEDVAATTDNEGSSVADGILPGDAKQYGTETLTGSAGNDLILADGYHGTGFENTQAMYAQLDPETGTGGTLYYAKEFQLSVAGYIRTVTSITISGLPEGVVALVLNGVTYSVANGKIVDGTVSIPDTDIIPNAKTMTIIYDVNAVANSAAGVDSEISVNIKGYGVGPIDTTKVFVWRFQDVDSTLDVTGNNPEYIQGSGTVTSGWSDIYVMETASAPHLILTYGGTYDTSLSFTANVTANAALAAADGDNLVYAGNSNDTIIAGNGNDTIFAYGGDDTIHAGDGVNVVWAGAGKDTVFSGTGADTIHAGQGDDSINAGDGANVIWADLTGTTGDAVENNGDGSDKITTGGNDDVIHAGGGNNVINAGSGDNTVWAGTGNDTVTTGSGNDIIDVGSGEKNIVFAGDGGNIVTASGNGANTLVGGAGKDVITGGSGNDTVSGGLGADTLDGGAGTDWVSFNGIDGTVTDGTTALSDWLSYSGSGAGVNIVLNASGGADTAVVGVTAISLAGFENFIGSQGNDIIDASAYAVAHTLYGLGGNDTLTGSGGDDVIFGGAGDDKLYGGAGNDTIDVGSGDAEDPDAASITFNSALGDSYTVNNSVDGGAGADTIVGGAGRDYFLSLAGQYADATDAALVDTFSGGDGIDTIEFQSYTVNMVIDMRSGTASAGGVLVARFSKDIEEIVSGTATNTTDTIQGSVGNDIIRGGNGTNSLISNGGSDSIYGGSGTDTITSNGGVDDVYYLDGGGGANEYRLYAGTETIIGTAGSSDRVFYNNNSLNNGDEDKNNNGVGAVIGSVNYGIFVNLDVLDYGVDADGTLTQDATSSNWWTGSGWVAMGIGTNSYQWLADNDQRGFYGDAQNDRYYGVEHIYGSNYNDVLIGNSSNNAFFGYGGSDAMYGLSGNDTFSFYYSGGNVGSEYIDGGSNTALTVTLGNGSLSVSGGDSVDYNNINNYMVINIDSIVHNGAAANRITGYGSDVTWVYDVENAYGGSNADTIHGTDGDNILDGRGGNNSVYGYGGNDFIYGATSTATKDYLNGGDGSDWVSYVNSGTNYAGGGVDVYLSNLDLNGDGTPDNIAGTSVFDTHTGYSRLLTSANDGVIDTLADFENIQGSNYNDRLAGNSGANTIWGMNGNDIIDGGAGADRLDGGGNTTLTVSGGGDTLWYHSSTAAVSVNLATNVVSGGWAEGDVISGFEHVRGSDYDDTLRGSSSINSIWGGGGADAIYGAGGGDYLLGEAGNDTFYLSSTEIGAVAVVNGGADTDRVSATNTWSFSAGTFTDAKWENIEEIYARDGTTGASESFGLNATDIQNIVDNGNSSALTLYLDSGDTFTFASGSGAASYTQTGGFTNGGALTAGTYHLDYWSGSGGTGTQVAHLNIVVA